MPKNGLFADDGRVQELAAFLKNKATAATNAITALQTALTALTTSTTDGLNALDIRVDAVELYGARIATLEQKIVVSDAPTKPAEGGARSYWVTSGVVWPAGVAWSVEPDGGTVPVVASRALVTLVTVAGVTYGAVGALYALPDLVPPVWSGTVTTGTPDSTSVVVVSSALASDDSGAVSYEYSINNGASWSIATRAGNVFTISGLSPSNTYPAPRFRARDAQGNFSNVLVAQGFTTTSIPVYHQNVLASAPSGFWPLDEGSGTVVVDRTSNGRNGTYFYAPTLTAASLCGDARAMESNAGDTSTAASRPFARVDHASWMNSASITLEAIYKPSNLVGSHMIMARWDGANLGSSQAVLFTDGVNLVARVNVAGVEKELRTTDNPLVLGTRYHVALTFNGTGFFLYINGYEAGYLVVTGALAQPTQALTIGAWSGASANKYQFAGVIDAPAFYTVALSTANLRTHAMAAGL